MEYTYWTIDDYYSEEVGTGTALMRSSHEHVWPSAENARDGRWVRSPGWVSYFTCIGGYAGPDPRQLTREEALVLAAVHGVELD